MIRIIGIEIKKSVMNIRFAISCVMMLLLMLTEQGVLLGYDVPGYSILTMLWKTNEHLWLQSDVYSWVGVFQRGISAKYLGVFLPLIAAFPSVPFFCDELRSGNYRFGITRSSKQCYISAKCIAAVASGCCVVLVAVFLFGMLCLIVFPALSEYSYVFDANVKNLTMQIVFLLAFAAMDALLCLTIASLTLNKFSCVCLPVVAFFLLQQISQKLYVRSHDIRFYVLSPDELYEPFQWLPELVPGGSIWMILLLPLSLSGIMYGMLLYFMRKQVAN